jgi:Sporulation and spore germination
MKRSSAIATTMALVVLSGCGRLSSDRYTRIDSAEIANAFTNASTTTTPPLFPSTTTAPPVVVTTTTTTIPTEAVRLYFITPDGKVRAVQRTRPAGITLTAVIAELAIGPIGADGAGLRTLVGGNVVRQLAPRQDSALVIDLDPLVLVWEESERALLAVQLYATLDNRPNSLPVSFTVSGEPWLPPLPAKPGFDYAAFIVP